MPVPDAAARFAILGGAFDPIHIGHIELAEQVRALSPIDSILFIPSFKHPLKNRSSYAPYNCRVGMLDIAIKRHTGLSVSNIEKEEKLSGYSIDTIKRLKIVYPGCQIDFIIGADNIEILSQWHRVEEFLDEVNMIICARPGFDPENSTSAGIANSTIIHTKTPDISSTAIRALLARQRYEEAKAMLPPGVTEYIRSEGLYL